MAAERFNFGRDWLKKALRLPWFAALALAAKVVPKDPRLWVLGRRYGFGDGPLALIAEIRRHDPEARILWITRDLVDDKLAEINGVSFARHSGFTALWACLRASYGVMTHGFSDLGGPAIWGAFTVQLWHGTPLKRVGLDMRQPGRHLLAPVVGAFQRYWNSHLGLVVAGSEVGRRRLASSMGVAPHKVQILGDPRCDLIISNCDKAIHTLKALAKRQGINEAERFVLYAPTWRESRMGSAEDVIYSTETDELLRMIDGVLVMRSHPYSGPRPPSRGQNRTIVLSPSEYPDLTSMLAGFDVLITDYSSVAMDFSLLERPIVFFAPDLGLYGASRGLYEPYAEFSGGAECLAWSEVVTLLKELSIDRQAYLNYVGAVTVPLRDRYNAYHAGGNSARVAKAVFEANQKKKVA